MNIDCNRHPPHRNGLTIVALLPSSEQETLAFLLPLSKDYPGIDQWFVSKVVPGLKIGTRTILRVERNGSLVGVGIGKRESTEQKICTVRIAPSHFGKGIGLKIFDGLLRWLDVDQPHLTVSEIKLPVFERIFDHYGFVLTSVQPNRYLPGVAELSYNEPFDLRRVATQPCLTGRQLDHPV